MRPGLAAEVCEGFYESLEELLSRDLLASARRTLLELQEQTGLAIDALNAESGEARNQREERIER